MAAQKPPANRPRNELGPRYAVCRSPQLFEISAALASGMSQNAVAKKFHFSQPVVWKHCKEHLGPASLEHNLTVPVLEQIRRLHARTLAVLDQAERACDPVMALQAVRECRHNLQLLARLTGEWRKDERQERQSSRLGTSMCRLGEQAMRRPLSWLWLMSSH